MNETLQTVYAGYAGTGALAVERNRVLRNTYWLLALSLVPTVLGAWIGVSHRHHGQPGAGPRRRSSSSAVRSASCSRSRRPRTRRPASACCWASRSSWA